MIYPKGEVLSPVGNEQMLVAAVRSGADAVYFGAKDFSARRNAENFDGDALKNAVKYCHIRGAKAYLTLNILIKDSEMADAVDLARRAHNYGIDGVIIEDLGLASVLNKLIPALPLHASTQMSVHSPVALKMLKALGFVRVVAAREMSESELRALCIEAKRLDMEIEVFVHGALCMSVSGQCLLSAFLGSRSGNRGLCAGPCRLPFEVKNGTGYDLSLKDLSLLPYIGKLSEMGVSSFKIEGRMKRPEYVAAATAACREAVDSGRASDILDNTLKSVFSRSGFTDGYYKNILGRAMFGIRTKEDVIAADSAFPFLHGLYRGERRGVKISARLTASLNEPLELTLSDGENTVTVSGDTVEPALKRSADEESLKSGIDKFGSTPYIAEDITVEYDDGVFVRAAALNELRRAATEQLDACRARVSREKSFVTYAPPERRTVKSGRPEIYARFESAEQIPDDLSGIAAVVFPLEKDFNADLSGVRLIADIPRGIISEELISDRLKLFKEKGFKEALCGNPSAVELAKNEGFKIIADTGLNIYNSESASAAEGFGAEEIILSSEILLSDANKLAASRPKGIVAYGNIPLMLFKNCPLKNGIACETCDKKGVITDRKNTEFPVRCRMGYSELLNSVPIWLADRIDELRFMDFVMLYFTREAPERVRAVISAYMEGGSPGGEYTRGLFYRGLI